LVFFIEPGVGFCCVDLGGGEFLFVGAVPEGAAVSAEVPDVEDIADETFLDELMCFAV
jgi:hypothetical protein